MNPTTHPLILKLQVGARSFKRFKCPRGHEQQGEYRVYLHGPDGLVEFTSGPLCRRCYVERLVAGCETAEVPP